MRERKRHRERVDTEERKRKREIFSLFDLGFVFPRHLRSLSLQHTSDFQTVIHPNFNTTVHVIYTYILYERLENREQWELMVWGE